ncbi:MAG: ABC transporter permease [archaeon]
MKKVKQTPVKKSEITATKFKRANVFTKLWYIFVKDFKLLVRSKVSALVFFLGPLIITLMVCMAFNTSSMYNINIAVYSEAYSPMSESIIANLSSGGQGAMQDYMIVKVGTLEECTESVKFDDFQVCIEFSPDMVTSNSASNKVKLYVDNSRVNIANQLADYMNTKLDVQSTEVSSGLIRQILDVLDSVNQKVAQQSITINKISEANSNGVSSLGSVIGEIGSLDLTLVEYNHSSIKSNLDSLTAQNISVSDLNSSVFGLVNAYTEALAKLDNAKSKAIELSNSANAVKNSLSEDKARIDSLKSSMDSISSSIGTIQVTNIESIVQPIRSSIEPLSQTKNYLAYIFSSLAAIIVMFISILMSSTAVIQERKSNAYFRNFISPTSDFLLMFGRYLTLLLIIAVEIALILVIGSFFLMNVPIEAYLLIGGVLLLEATCFIFLGMFLGYLFETGESVTIAAISVSTVSLFLSNVVLPVELMSGVLRAIVMYNPFVITEGVIKKVLLFSPSMGMFPVLLAILAGYALLFFGLTVIMWALDKRLMA